VDRHWHIGLGHIGRDALRRVAQHPQLAHAAFLLETPQDDVRDDVRNLDELRAFVSETNGSRKGVKAQRQKAKRLNVS
jgi:deoxyribonuclease-4